MTKYLVHIFFVVVAILLVVVFISRQETTELPAFIKIDEIANAHKSNVKLTAKTAILPSESERVQFISDYSNLWAHLNYLYSTNDVEKGKEYYTEGFFKSICKNRNEIQPQYIVREDVSHDVVLQSWSWDALVCVGVDTQVILKYIVKDKEPYYTKSKVAFALLFQGDHWRIDGMKFIEEKKYNLK